MRRIKLAAAILAAVAGLLAVPGAAKRRGGALETGLRHPLPAAIPGPR
jgi:hypothetical protein